jgi:hypothetical protein
MTLEFSPKDTVIFSAGHPASESRIYVDFLSEQCWSAMACRKCCPRCKRGPVTICVRYCGLAERADDASSDRIPGLYP